MIKSLVETGLSIMLFGFWLGMLVVTFVSSESIFWPIMVIFTVGFTVYSLVGLVSAFSGKE